MTEEGKYIVADAKDIIIDTRDPKIISKELMTEEPLDKKFIDLQTGENSDTKVWHESDIKEAARRVEDKNIWQPDCPHICISRKDWLEIFGELAR